MIKLQILIIVITSVSLMFQILTFFCESFLHSYINNITYLIFFNAAASLAFRVRFFILWRGTDIGLPLLRPIVNFLPLLRHLLQAIRS